LAADGLNSPPAVLAPNPSAGEEDAPNLPPMSTRLLLLLLVVVVAGEKAAEDMERNPAFSEEEEEGCMAGMEGEGVSMAVDKLWAGKDWEEAMPPPPNGEEVGKAVWAKSASPGDVKEDWLLPAAEDSCRLGEKKELALSRPPAEDEALASMDEVLEEEPAYTAENPGESRSRDGLDLVGEINPFTICCCCCCWPWKLLMPAIGGPRAPTFTPDLTAGPKLRLEARLAREESRSPVITLGFDPEATVPPAGWSTSPNRLAPPELPLLPVWAG